MRNATNVKSMDVYEWCIVEVLQILHMIFSRNATNVITILPFYVSLFFGVDKGVPLLLHILRCNEEFIPT